MRRNSETAIGGRYATRRVILAAGPEESATGVSLTALTEHVHSVGAIPPGRKCLLLIHTNRLRAPGETAIGGLHATRCVVLAPGVELSATVVILTALTECVHSDAAIQPERNCF